jgi:phage-related baseplate assembly protein
MTSQIVAVAMGVAGVYAVELTAPADNVVIAAKQVPELGDVTLVMEAASNE